MPIELGQILEGKYLVVRLIGQGGMGAVYEGENKRIKRRVAIKVLHASAASDPEIVTRFEREAQAAGRIGSDHILEILDLGSLPSGDHYIVMEYLDGESLRSRIDRLGRLPPHHAIGLLIQVLVGLAAAHRAQIVHRDLKPENIFVVREKAGSADFAKIIDFGISKFSALGTDVRMTRTGMVMGTPLYMSPEQASGAETDLRSDLYAVGVILYEALSGRAPFSSTNYNELILKIALTGCPALASVAPDVPPALCAIVDKATSRDVSQRFQSAEAFAEALAHFAATNSTRQETMATGGAPFAPQGTIAWPFDAKGAPFAASGRDSGVTVGVDRGALSPINASPTAAGWQHTERNDAPSKSKAGLWLAASVVTALLVSSAIYLSTRQSIPAPPPAAAGPAVSSAAASSAAATSAPTSTAEEAPSALDIPATPPAATVTAHTEEPRAAASVTPVGNQRTSPPASPTPQIAATPTVQAPQVPRKKSAPTGNRHTESAPDLGY